MNNSISISIKKNQVIIKIDENAEQKEIISALKKKIIELKNLYKDDKTPILVTGKVLKNKEMDEIQNIVKRFINVQIDFDSPKVLGLHGIKKTFYKEVATSETKFHKGSLRSGQRLEFEGSLVIIGDVNAGAEVIAGENIVVLGNLRGLAHAGAKGNKDAVIEAVEIEALQVRIADIVKEIEKDEYGIRKIRTSAYINENDELIDVRLTDGNNEIIMVTRHGLSIRFKEEEVRAVGRTSMGVKGIELAKDDKVVGMEPIKEDNGYVLTITENGFGKRTELEEYRCQGRAGKGVLTYKITAKTGNIVGVEIVDDDDDVMMITDNGIIIRINVNDISILGRNTQGVTLMRTSDGGKLINIAKLPNEEQEEN